MTMRAFILCVWLAIWPAFGYAISLDDYADEPQNHVLFIRHALAPGTGDPANFKFDDCQTQRNLSEAGRVQARRIGDRLRAKNLKIAAILSSQWCRCAQTATEMNLGPVIFEAGLNSFYQDIVPREATLAQLRQKLSQIDGTQGITIMVTHFVTISAITGMGVSSGDMVSYNPQTGQAMLIEGE